MLVSEVGKSATKVDRSSSSHLGEHAGKLPGLPPAAPMPLDCLPPCRNGPTVSSLQEWAEHKMARGRKSGKGERREEKRERKPRRTRGERLSKGEGGRIQQERNLGSRRYGGNSSGEDDAGESEEEDERGKEMVEIEEQEGICTKQQSNDDVHGDDTEIYDEKEEPQQATNDGDASHKLDVVGSDLDEEEKSEAAIEMSDSFQRLTILQDTTDFILSIPSLLVDAVFSGRETQSFAHVPSTEVELARLEQESTSDASSGEEESDDGSGESLLEAGEDFLTDSEDSEIAKIEAGNEREMDVEIEASSRRGVVSKSLLKCFSATVCAIFIMAALNSLRHWSWGSSGAMKHDISYYMEKYEKKPQPHPNRSVVSINPKTGASPNISHEGEISLPPNKVADVWRKSACERCGKQQRFCFLSDYDAKKQLDVLASFPWVSKQVTAEAVLVTWKNVSEAKHLHERLNIHCVQHFETRFLQVPMYLINRLVPDGMIENLFYLARNIAMRRSRGRRFILLTEGSLLNLATLFEISRTAVDYRKRVYEINHTAFVVPFRLFDCGKDLTNSSKAQETSCFQSANQNQQMSVSFESVVPQGVLIFTCPSIFRQAVEALLLRCHLLGRIRGYAESPRDGGLDKEIIFNKLDEACGFNGMNKERQDKVMVGAPSSDNYTLSNSLCDLLQRGNLLGAFQGIKRVVTKSWGFPDVGMFERRYRNRIP
eukprot:379895-Hanusia_phi.AAC.6